MTTRATPSTRLAALALAAAALAALPAAAIAQYEITIDVENPVLMPGESTTVTIFAGFGGSDWAMAGLATNVVTSVGSEGWSDAMVVGSMAGPGTSAGLPSSTGFDFIIAGQIQAIGAGIYADPSNPIAFWEATYTAPLDIAAPFGFDFSTVTTRYDVYVDRGSSLSESRLADLVEGSATIRVIPAPASALVLAGGLLVMRRRR